MDLYQTLPKVSEYLKITYKERYFTNVLIHFEWMNNYMRRRKGDSILRNILMISKNYSYNLVYFATLIDFEPSAILIIENIFIAICIKCQVISCFSHPSLQ